MILVGVSCEPEDTSVSFVRETYVVEQITDTTAYAKGCVYPNNTLNDIESFRCGFVWALQPEYITYDILNGSQKYVYKGKSGSSVIIQTCTGGLDRLTMNRQYHTENYFALAGTGTENLFAYQLNGLQPNTKYYIRAFAIIEFRGQKYLILCPSKEFCTTNNS